MTRVMCPSCQSYSVANSLISKLLNAPEICLGLQRVARWCFYRGNPIVLRTIYEAEMAILTLRAFEEDHETQQRLAVAALVENKRYAAPDKWDAGWLHPVSSALGLSQDEARAFVENLEAQGIVEFQRLDPRPAPPGHLPFGPVGCWECKAQEAT